VEDKPGAGRYRPTIRSPLVSHAISFGAAALAATVVFLFAPGWFKPTTRVVAAYDVFALALLAWYWWIAFQRDPAAAGRRAATEDPGRNVVMAVVFGAVAFGFVAALAILARNPNDADPHHVALLYAIGLGAVILGWLLIHTILAFRYARLYYQDRDGDNKSDGGLIFPGGAEPNDLDFAYFSFVLGMTFQVSDVQICSTVIRRLALAHGMVSFGYNTAILALGVNVISNLLHG
jgi:uncharacterized membrane protein